jgi:catechol 2,3-dioxygenase-like lactoylglutathione lyase family enzyme
MKNYLLIFLFLGKSVFAQQTESNFVNISKIGLSVKDIQKSASFYNQVFHLEQDGNIEKRQPSALEIKQGLNGGSRKVLKMKGYNSSIELMEFEPNKKHVKNDFLLQNPGITHVCYQSSIDKPIYARAISNRAVAVSKGTKPINRGYGIRYAYVHDLDKAIFELEEFEKSRFETELIFGHVAVSTSNIDSLVSFYTTLFGYPPRNRADNIKNSFALDSVTNIDGMELRGAWFTVGKMNLEIWEFEKPKPLLKKVSRRFQEIGYNKITFDVKNFEEEITRMRTLGFNPQVNNNRNLALLKDIDGNLLEFKQTNND